MIMADLLFIFLSFWPFVIINTSFSALYLTCSTVSPHHLRAPGPQKPPSSVADDIVRSNHYDPDEDEDYYRKQLSYFDKLQAGPNKPQPQAQATHNFRWSVHYHQRTLWIIIGGGYNYCFLFILVEYSFVLVVFMGLTLLSYRSDSVEKPSPVEKKYEPIPQVTPSLPPATLPKPAPEGRTSFWNETLVPLCALSAKMCIISNNLNALFAASVTHAVVSSVCFFRSQASCPRGHGPDQLPASQEFPGEISS